MRAAVLLLGAILGLAGRAGAQPAAAHDRAFWVALAGGGFEVPAGSTAVELLTEMNALLGSPDPVLRDDVAYGAAERWLLRDRRLSPDEVRQVVAMWSRNLDVGLGEAGTDTIYLRSFSALCLSVAAAADLTRPVFDPREVQALLDRALDYFARERDLRGFDAEHGWMHSVAHTADLLKFLARSPKLAAGSGVRLLDAVSGKIHQADAVFTWGENDRMALALHATVRRGEVDPPALDAWLARWLGDYEELWARGPMVQPAQFVRVENARQVMRSLHAALSMDASPTAAGAAAARAILAALAKMR
ncbi:MAG: DUF2785 domain-containing protein [Vicinamibacterales bacterium]